MGSEGKSDFVYATIDVGQATDESAANFFPELGRLYHRDQHLDRLYLSSESHFLVMLQTAKAFGLTEEEIFSTPMLSEFRAKIDFMRSIVYEGTTAEWYASVTTEEQIGHWSAVCYEALTTHYGFDREKATYFATHVEADLEEHEEGVMGHASFNRCALQRLLESGMADERPTYGVEYCAMTSVDLHGVMLRAAMEATRGS